MARAKPEILVEMDPEFERTPRAPKPRLKPAKKPKPKKAKPPKRRAWGKPLDVCGQRWDVVTIPEHAGEYGQTIYAENVIEVSEGPEASMQDTLVHECLHAIMDNSGFRWDLKNIGLPKMTAAQLERLEELICRRFAPAIVGTFRGAGWLELPKKPRRHTG